MMSSWPRRAHSRCVGISSSGCRTGVPDSGITFSHKSIQSRCGKRGFFWLFPEGRLLLISSWQKLVKRPSLTIGEPGKGVSRGCSLHRGRWMCCMRVGEGMTLNRRLVPSAVGAPRGFLSGKLAGAQGHPRKWEGKAGLRQTFCISGSFFFFFFFLSQDQN